MTPVGDLDVLLAAVRIPETDEDRAAAIAAFAAQAGALHAAGRHEDVVQLAQAWHKEADAQAPEDELALAELRAVAGWALHMSGDEHAAERALALAWADAVQAERTAAGGPRHARAQRALALLTDRRGLLQLEINQDPEAARSFFVGALRLLGGSQADAAATAQVLLHLGLADDRRGYHRTAFVYLQQAVAQLEPASTIERATALAALAGVEDELGDEEAAERDLRAALALALETTPGDSTHLAAVHAQLGEALLRWGSPQEAEVHLRFALGIFNRTSGALRTDAAELTLTLAHVLWGRGHIEDAISLAVPAGRVADIELRHRLELGAEEVRIRRAALSRTGLDLCLSLASEHPRDPRLAQGAIDAVLRRKALLTEIFATQRAAQRAFERSGFELELDELDRLREQRSEALLAGDADAVRTLAREIARREEMIGFSQRLHLDFAVEDEPGAPEARQARLAQWESAGDAVHAALPADAALVEYVRFSHLAARPHEATPPGRRYLALVWRAGAPLPTIVPLGDAARIDALVADLRGALDADARAFERDKLGAFAGSPTEAAAGALRLAALDPLLPAIGDARQLLLAPDGALALVPFAVLPMPEGQLVDRFELTHLSSGRDLLRPAVTPPDGFEPPVVIADPDYDGGGPARDEPFARLRGTRREGDEVAGMLGVQPLLDLEANEGRLKAVRSPTVLHVATHGWFLPDADGEKPPAWARLPRFAELVDGGVSSWLVRSGLVLAGFNAVWTGEQAAEELGDGLLTAGEAAALDLTGTELVVLSACETGLGQAADLEGIYGLRRGFLMAGARALVMSMWPVPDEPTRMLMLEFYRRVLAGETRAAALREAQREVRKTAQHPFTWAGFALHGDPVSLELETLAALREAAPEIDSGDDANADAQRRLAGEALRRGDHATAERRARPLAEAGDAASAAVLGAIAAQRGDTVSAERWYREAAEAGNATAAFALGLLKRTAGDAEEKLRWWTLAAEGGNHDAMHALALSLLERGDRAGALRWWRTGAEGGDPTCLNSIGIETARDGKLEAAEAWWRKAAGAGVASAAYNLASGAQERGDAAELDRWYRRAAELGHPDAAKDLAMRAHQEGRIEEALDLWRAAASAGDVEAAHNAGFVLQERGAVEAERWYRIGAAAGFASSANNLGNMLEQRGDLDGAKAAWRIAAEAGHGRACGALGHALLDEGALAEAEPILRRGAEAGDPPAAYAYSELLERAGSASQAQAWLSQSADAGHSRANLRLGNLLVERGDVDGALQRWGAAAEAGSAAAGTRIGLVLAQAGELDDADAWLAGAATAGEADAALALAAYRERRGDRAGALAALALEAVAGSDDVRKLGLLLGTDEGVFRERAARGHASAMKALYQLAELRGDENECRRWLLALAGAGEPEDMERAGRAAGDEALLRAAAERGRPGAARALAELVDEAEAQELRAQAERLERADATHFEAFDAFASGDRERAAQLWRTAAEAGSTRAAANLGSLLMGTPESAHWLELAAERGDAGSAVALAALAAQDGDHARARTWLASAVAVAGGH